MADPDGKIFDSQVSVLNVADAAENCPQQPGMGQILALKGKEPGNHSGETRHPGYDARPGVFPAKIDDVLEIYLAEDELLNNQGNPDNRVPNSPFFKKRNGQGARFLPNMGQEKSYWARIVGRINPSWDLATSDYWSRRKNY
ncbi:MAG: hypothetical protein M0P73_13575 [Syntrophobacterales bacterium]|nr:hypothetical protein [Syntrophobacterales bacterium]